MGCAPSIHISESRAAYQGGKEAEDAPDPAAPPLPPTLPGGTRLPHGPKTAAPPGTRGASLSEPESRDGNGQKVRGAGREGKLGPAATFPQNRAGLPRGRGAGGPALGDSDGRWQPVVRGALRAGEHRPGFSGPGRWNWG